jgi:hypothetical protein
VILEKVILYIYPMAIPNQDFYIMDDGNGPEIRHWKYNGPVPTIEQLQAAWNEIEVTPPQQSLEEKLVQMEQDVADLWYSVMMGGLA